MCPVMGGWRAQWLWCTMAAAVLITLTHRARGCNVREISDIIQRRFREEVAAQCATVGDKCSFDRECCKGLECSMSASQTGVGLSCQRAWLMDPDRGDMAFETPDSQADEPKSDDTDWMVVKTKEDLEEHLASTENKMYPTDMLTEIENLQAKKKSKLLRENHELEKLFTEREEKELEQLRVLRKDAEMDELRRLKELRLKRKMQLIKELEELRGLKAENDMNNIDELRVMNANKTKEVPSIGNQTDLLEYDIGNSSKPSITSVDLKQPDVTEPRKEENVPVKHKQGIHEAHHKRKHHHHKKQHPNLEHADVDNGEKNENATEIDAR